MRIIEATKNQIIDYSDNKKEFWLFKLRFSDKTYRLTEILLPTKVSFRIFKSGSNDYFEIYNISTNKRVESFVRLLYEYNDYCYKLGCYLYETEKECKDGFESVINDKVDKLQSFYESKLKYLQSIKKRLS